MGHMDLLDLRLLVHQIRIKLMGATIASLFGALFSVVC